MKRFVTITALLIITVITYASGAVADESGASADSSGKSHRGSIGFKGGLNFSNVDNFGGVGFLDATESYTGIRVGSYVELALSSSLSVRTELLYSKRGFDIQDLPRTDELGNMIESRLEHRITYLEIPISVAINVPIGDRAQFGFLAGPMMSILLDATLRHLNAAGSGNSSQVIESDLSRDVQTIDLGLALGSRVTVIVIGNPLFVESNYSFGVSNMFVSGDRKHRIVSLSIGYGFFF